MAENAIDGENISKPAPDMAKPKGGGKAGKKAKPAKKAGCGKKPAQQAQGGSSYTPRVRCKASGGQNAREYLRNDDTFAVL
jgi:hypothetical protein